MEVKLNQLSKLKVIFTLCSVILLAGCASGAGDSGDSSGADYSQFDNSTLNCNLELKDSCTIRNLDLNGNVVLVKAKGVVLDGAKNGKVIVDSSVGDGDFTMKNCKDIKKCNSKRRRLKQPSFLEFSHRCSCCFKRKCPSCT